MKRFLVLFLAVLLFASPAHAWVLGGGGDRYNPSFGGTIALDALTCLNWNASDVTLCHSADTLTLAGGNLLFSTDGSFNIGAAGATRPGKIYVSDAINFTGFGFIRGATIAGGNGVYVRNNADSANGNFEAAILVIDTRLDIGTASSLFPESAGVVQLGADAAAPVAQTFKGADARAGTDDNTAGGDFTLGTGRGTGTGTPGRGYLNATVKTGAGSGAQTAAEVASWGSTNGDNRGFRYLTHVQSQGGAGADTTEDVRNGYIRVTAAATRTLSARTTVGQAVIYVSTTAAVISVDVASGSDYIILNGTALAAGNKATSDGTIGAMLTCVNEVANYWRCQAVQGVWSDGGA